MGDRLVGVADQPTGAGIADIRTRERVVAALTVDEQYVIAQRERVISGSYLSHPGSFTVQAAAHAATAGFFWIVNTSSALLLALRKFDIDVVPTAATVFASAPRITAERITFTGTPSGAIVTPARARRTAQNGSPADAAPTGTLRTANTGMTITAGEAFWAGVVPPVMTAVGHGTPAVQGYDSDDEDLGIVLAAGEGIVLRQADAGTASDTRRIVPNVVWEEFTLP